MSKIQSLQAMEILDSRGNPTVQVTVQLEDGSEATAAVPSGASTGAFEAHELRDGDENRYLGKGVLTAVENINTEIFEAVVGMEVQEQRAIDQKMIELDGTENKSRLGANAILGASLAVCRVAALSQGKPLYQHIHDLYFAQSDISLPIPMFNILNGGQHADSGLSIQEFKIVPKGISGYEKQLQAGSEIFHVLKKQLARENFVTSVGDEGGFAPRLDSNEQALEVIERAIEAADYKGGEEIFISIDAAANSFYREEEKQYVLEPESKVLSRENLITIYREWSEKHPLLSIEDGLEENDWEGWSQFSKKMSHCMLVGDDLLVTNEKRLKKAIETKACNSILIKPNQIGTVTETADTMNLAKSNAMKRIVSHRSGETMDTFISDLAVAAGAEFMKSGAPNRGERVCKYNRLLEINTRLS